MADDDAAPHDYEVLVINTLSMQSPNMSTQREDKLREASIIKGMLSRFVTISFIRHVEICSVETEVTSHHAERSRCIVGNVGSSVGGPVRQDACSVLMSSEASLASEGAA